LHNQKVRIVDVKLDGVEEILHLTGLNCLVIDHVLVLSSNHNLAHRNKRICVAVSLLEWFNRQTAVVMKGEVIQCHAKTSPAV